MPLVAFDFDGTLSDDEMTVLLGEAVGKANSVANVTEQAMAGEIEYAESLRRRVSFFEGLSLSAVDDVFDGVRLRPGAADLLQDLRAGGATVAIVTGGFERGVEAALARDGVEVDAIIANSLVDDGEALTGEVEGPLVEGTKDAAITALVRRFGARLGETVAVGDGANDVPMLRAAGLAIGYDPKPTVADHVELAVGSMAELREVFADEGLVE